MKTIRTLTIGIAAVLAVALGASGVTYALWSSQATASSSVAAGAVGVTLTGGDSLTVTYSGSTLVKAGALTVTNTGSVASNYSTSVALTATSSSGLASGVSAAVWPRGSAGSCATTAPVGATTGSWSTAFAAISGSALAAGSSTVWCVLTSVTGAQATTFASQDIAPTITTTASIGSWTATSATSSAQKVSVPPRVVPNLMCSNNGTHNAIVSWNNVPGANSATRYEVWVNGQPLSTSNNSGYTNLNIGWGTLVPNFAANNSTPVVEVYERLANGSLNLIAQGTVSVRTDQYTGYSWSVVQCS